MASQKLIHKGSVLKDTQTLKDSKIGAGSKLALMGAVVKK
jgi:Ubiquitin family